MVVVVLLGSLAQRVSTFRHDGQWGKEKGNASSIRLQWGDNVVIQSMQSIEHDGTSSASGPEMWRGSVVLVSRKNRD
jgi:hypothetical protein